MPLLYCFSVALIQFHTAEIGACSWCAQLMGDENKFWGFWGGFFFVKVERAGRISAGAFRWGLLCLRVRVPMLARALPKHQKIWSTSVQMQSQSAKGRVFGNSCSFLLLLVCSAKDSLLRMAQHEWLSLDFILARGHASFYSERGAERQSREKPD